jgi:hypothetical protein
VQQVRSGFAGDWDSYTASMLILYADSLLQPSATAGKSEEELSALKEQLAEYKGKYEQTSKRAADAESQCKVCGRCCLGHPCWMC